MGGAVGVVASGGRVGGGGDWFAFRGGWAGSWGGGGGGVAGGSDVSGVWPLVVRWRPGRTLVELPVSRATAAR